MALGTAEFADAMKTYYIGPLNDQVYRKTVLLDRLQKNSEDVDGNFAYLPLITGRNPGVGSRKDTAALGPSLPAAGIQTYDNLTFKMALHYGRGSITGPVMRASKSSAGSFAKALDIEMKGLSQRLPEDLNRQLWSNGNGRAATLAGGTTAGSSQVTSTTILINSHAIFGARVGDRVHFRAIDGTGGFTPAAGTTILGITRDTSTFQHSILLAAASGATLTNNISAMYFGGAETLTAEKSSLGQEMYGIPATVDDGNVGADEGLGSGIAIPTNAAEELNTSLQYGGLDRTAIAIMRSQVLQNPAGAGTNRALTVALMEQAFLTAITVGGASEQSIEIYTNPGLWATFGLLHIGDRIFNDFKEKLAGGWIALMFNNRPLFYDRDAPRDIIWFLDMETLMLLSQSGYELMDDDGSVLSRVADRDAYEFTLHRDIQLGCNNLAKNVRLDDITTSLIVEASV